MKSDIWSVGDYLALDEISWWSFLNPCYEYHIPNYPSPISNACKDFGLFIAALLYPFWGHMWCIAITARYSSSSISHFHIFFWNIVWACLNQREACRHQHPCQPPFECRSALNVWEPHQYVSIIPCQTVDATLCKIIPYCVNTVIKYDNPNSWRT